MKNIIPRRRQSGEVSKGTGEVGPFGEFAFSLSRMRDELDRLFERMSREFSTLTKWNGEGWHWDLVVEDQDDNVVVRADAPGFDAADFDIRVEDGRLVLRATKKVETKDEKGKVSEYREQACYESIDLPTSVDKEKVDAKYRNGVLTVTLPKTAAGKAKRIAVKTA